MAEPALRRADQTPRNARALPAGKFAHHERVSWSPRELRERGWQLGAGDVDEGGQQRACGKFSGTDELQNSKVSDRSRLRICKSQRAIRGAQIDSDAVHLPRPPGYSFIRTLSSSFQRPGP